jgi:hypothetical protein
MTLSARICAASKSSGCSRVQHAVISARASLKRATGLSASMPKAPNGRPWPPVTTPTSTRPWLRQSSELIALARDPGAQPARRAPPAGLEPATRPETYWLTSPKLETMTKGRHLSLGPAVRRPLGKLSHRPDDALGRRSLRIGNRSGRPDLNRGPPRPKRGALPGCATPRACDHFSPQSSRMRSAIRTEDGTHVLHELVE